MWGCGIRSKKSGRKRVNSIWYSKKTAHVISAVQISRIINVACNYAEQSLCNGQESACLSHQSSAAAACSRFDAEGQLLVDICCRHLCSAANAGMPCCQQSWWGCFTQTFERCLLQFSPKLHRIPRVFHIHRNPWVFQVFQLCGLPVGLHFSHLRHLEVTWNVHAQSIIDCDQGGVKRLRYR